MVPFRWGCGPGGVCRWRPRRKPPVHKSTSIFWSRGLRGYVARVSRRGHEERLRRLAGLARLVPSSKNLGPRARGTRGVSRSLREHRHRPASSRGSFDVIGTAHGNATTDFGAPDARGPWDEIELSASELVRQLGVLQDCWNYFDTVVENAPLALRRGPRGGGRDRDHIVDHVREAERAYCSRMGFRVAPRTPWDEQRDVVLTTLRSASPDAKWPTAYAIRRCAWHVVDHAWEIEDKSGE